MIPETVISNNRVVLSAYCSVYCNVKDYRVKNKAYLKQHHIQESLKDDDGLNFNFICCLTYQILLTKTALTKPLFASTVMPAKQNSCFFFSFVIFKDQA